MSKELATMGGGCFWCLDGAFRRVKGVESVQSGYAGGPNPNPTYDDVCSGQSGHAEVIQIEFENEIITYENILMLFFSLHDPTTLNRQGADVGTQYRSVIFYHTQIQKNCAESIIDRLNQSPTWSDPIVTELAPSGPFFIAETYHQNYYDENPSERYCQLVIEPKIEKFVNGHQELMKR